MIRSFQNHITALSGGNLIIGNTDINRQRIDGPCFQIHKCRIVIRILIQCSEGICQLFLITFQSGECGRILLYPYSLACKIRLHGNTGIISHNKHLAVIHIRNTPCILVFPAVHCKSVPNTINRAGIQLHILGIPVNRLLNQLPALTLTHLSRQIQIKAHIFSASILITIGREFRVETNYKLTPFSRIRCRRALRFLRIRRAFRHRTLCRRAALRNRNRLTARSFGSL